MVIVPEWLQSEVEVRVQELLIMARSAYGRSFQFPEIRYKVSGKVAGRASYQGYWMDFNAALLVDNVKYFMEHTIPHELAHLITGIMYPSIFHGRKMSHHGREWKTVMVMLGADPARCHSLDVTKVARTRITRKFRYVCDFCNGTVELGTKRHRKQQTFGGMYWHKCDDGRRGRLTYLGERTPPKPPERVIQTATAEDRGQLKPSPRPSGRVSNMELARNKARSNPGITSKELRDWLVLETGCSAHSARGTWSKLKKEALVT